MLRVIRGFNLKIEISCRPSTNQQMLLYMVNMAIKNFILLSRL